MRWTRAVSLASLAFVVAGAWACGEAFPVCYEGDRRACSCAEGASGFQTCAPELEAYGPCVCDGTTPGVDGSAPTPDAAPESSSKIGFLEPCLTNEECETGLCHPFNAKGPRCSQPCKEPTDCPPPSTGCNNQGVCKAP